MKPKDAVHIKNSPKVYNALYGNYKVIYPFFKFDIGDKVRISKRRGPLKRDTLQIGLKNYFL